jgi:hypothetical protein
MTTFNNYADVQAGLTAFVNQSGVNVDGAPHGAFWQNMDYTEFTTGNMPLPGQDGVWPILVCGNSAESNLVQILEGMGAAAQRFGRMPRPRPPYEPEQSDLIAALAAWIDAGCPNPASEESADGEYDGTAEEDG